MPDQPASQVDAHPDSLPGAIRVAARAVIVEEGRLLAINYRDEIGSWFVTPGGGIAKFETLIQGLKREVHEELGIDLEVGELLYVRELLGRSVKVKHGGITDRTHQLEAFFLCRRVGEIRPGHEPDNYCVGYTWLPLETLHTQHFFPAALSKRLAEDFGRGFQGRVIYLGDS